jgi:hypothetical protein
VRKKNQLRRLTSSDFMPFIIKAAYLYVHFAKIYLEGLTWYNSNLIAMSMLVDPAYITIRKHNHQSVPLQQLAVRHNIPVHRSSPVSHITKFQRHDLHQLFEGQVSSWVFSIYKSRRSFNPSSFIVHSQQRQQPALSLVQLFNHKVSFILLRARRLSIVWIICIRSDLFYV